MTPKKHHLRSKHNQLYDFEKLTSAVPDLKKFLTKNPSGEVTIPFAEPEAVKLLNKALLLSEYDLSFWDIPGDQLCPPVPGRADYIHYLADLLEEKDSMRILDVGVGANLIYPIIGTSEYNWDFVGVDCSKPSLENAKEIIEKNTRLSSKIILRFQSDSLYVLKGIIQEEERFDAVMCNPPFYGSKDEAYAQTERKLRNLNEKKEDIVHNFGGKDHELWFPGGEVRFISLMIKESVSFKNQVGWFTSLVSNKDSLYPLQKLLKKVGADVVEVVKMQQGNKQSRFIAWRFN